MKKLMIVVSLVLIMLGLGCTAMSHYVTYAEIDRNAVEYAVDAGVAEPNDYDDWWTNIVTLERLERDVDGGHKIVQLNLKQLIQKDDLEYSLVKDFIFLNYVSLEGGEYNIVEPIWLKFLASQCIWRKREVKDGDTPVSDRPGS